MSVFEFFGKYILYLFNLLSLISSICIIAIALVITQKFYTWSSFIKPDLITAPQVLLVIGLVVFVIAIVGLCGVIRDSSCLLAFFSILLLIALIGELILSGAIFVMRGDVEQYAMNVMNQTIPKYNQTNQEVATQAWDILQSDGQCCGINKPDDWRVVTHSDELPSSCCHEFPAGKSCTTAYAYPNGCLKLLKDMVQDNSHYLIYTGVGFAAVQLLAVLLACYHRHTLFKEYETV
ncbi:tetraspanin-9-like [Adelges cooleyi]|uniref:tetraspanin-9-like n=1 Tax=Adelges cooleyi TaxID=133065 RepID=UPI00217FE356|nr:tetraspanin-9-like [Adelges cooleyi]